MKKKNKKRKALRCFYNAGRIIGFFCIAFSILFLFKISGEESIFGKSVLMSFAVLFGMIGAFWIFAKN